MEKEPEAFEWYPLWIVLAFNLASFLSYAIGAYLLFLVGMVWGILYITYLIYLELSTYREGCVCCYYYGKRCASGRGRIAPYLFKKDDPKKFCEKEVTVAKILPHFLVLLFPLIGGAILLLQNFRWGILLLMLIPPLIWFMGNPVIYGKLACPHCKQGRICCPANEFFSKKYSGKKK